MARRGWGEDTTLLQVWHSVAVKQALTLAATGCGISFMIICLVYCVEPGPKVDFNSHIWSA